MLTKPAQTTAISDQMPYETRYISVKGSNMAYVEAGEGDPILFLHGNPTSKYLWRNIMPWLENHGRVIAPDLIGMGESDQPDLQYSYHEQYAYLEAFINKLDLDNITLVLHDWGSGLGFNFAAQNPDRIKAIAFMEALVRPMSWSNLPSEFRLGFRMMRTPLIGWLMVILGNAFITQMLPQAIVRELTATETGVYSAPYKTLKSRRPLLKWPREVPLDGQPSDVHRIIDNYSRWLQTSDLPKLLFTSSPGAIIDGGVADWVKQSFPNLTSHDIGPGIHFIQEDNPHFIGEKLDEWYAQLP